MSDEAKVVIRFPIFDEEDGLGASFEILSDGTFCSSGEAGSLGYRIASRTIDAIQAIVSSRRWIPITERLPEDAEQVAVYLPQSKEVVALCYSEAMNQWTDYEGYHFDVAETMWQPLPEPPKP